MFREQWGELENQIRRSASEFKEKVFGEDRPIRSPEEFKEWAEVYVSRLSQKVDSEKMESAKQNFLVLLRNLGINDEVLVEAFSQNKKELLDPVIGEAIAIVALVLGWSNKDKEQFSQALGEIGVVGVFAAKPFICLIAVCGLAYGYHRNFHKESFKKGGVIGLSGLMAAALSPGGFVGLLAAIVVMIYFNKKLSIDRPVETQLKEIYAQIRSGDFFRETRDSWRSFEEFLSKLLKKPVT